MDEVQVENIWRWRAWRRACEAGWDRAESYDLYLHPDTRVGIEAVPDQGVPEFVTEGGQ